MAKKKEKVNPFKSWGLQDFQNSIAEYKDKYPRAMLISFYEYWSEPNEMGVMRFQLGKTWQTSGRLATWNRNNFGNNGQQINKTTFGNPTSPAAYSKQSNADKRASANSASRTILGV